MPATDKLRVPTPPVAILPRHTVAPMAHRTRMHTKAQNSNDWTDHTVDSRLSGCLFTVGAFEPRLCDQAHTSMGDTVLGCASRAETSGKRQHTIDMNIPLARATTGISRRI
jgi:hypothetical protein